VANTSSTSKYFDETLTNIKDAYHQLPYYQRNKPSLTKPNHLNDQLHPQDEEELGQYLADIFSQLNINEQEESIQQTTKQVSHQKNRDKEEQNPEEEGSRSGGKRTNEQQRKKTTTCQNQTQEISRSLKESGSHNPKTLHR
jgi:hypothetical protein